MWVNTGDKHGEHSMHLLSSKRYPEGKDLTKNDIVCITGDFGVLWRPSQTKEEKYWIDWLNDRPFTVCFIDGNHENFERLNAIDEEDFLEGRAGQVSDNIYHLKRGQIYTYQGKKIFCFGGAASHDKAYRIEGITWWKEEEPSYSEVDFALCNLKKHNNMVDYVITHTAPKAFISQISAFDNYLKCQTAEFLDNVVERIQFDQWFFGHMHVDHHAPEYKYNALYNDFVRMI
ncbi:metallophosphoesterase [bacterium]|nr:metallophosphoesterase [bacterium]MBI9072928.1 metallophosphoesterase [Melioribacteraceae bacterium]